MVAGTLSIHHHRKLRAEIPIFPARSDRRHIPPRTLTAEHIFPYRQRGNSQYPHRQRQALFDSDYELIEVPPPPKYLRLPTMRHPANSASVARENIGGQRFGVLRLARYFSAIPQEFVVFRHYLREESTDNIADPANPPRDNRVVGP